MKTNKELKERLAPKSYHTPYSERWALGKVRCVGRVTDNTNGGVTFWTGYSWVVNCAYAKRYHKLIAWFVALIRGGEVCRYYEDGCGNHPLRRA